MDNQTRRRNWRYFLSHGVFYALKRRLAEPKVFLPFICVAAGAPVMIAALVVPLFMLSKRSGELMSAPIVSATGQKRFLVISGIAGIAIGLMLALIAVSVSLPVLIMVCLAAAAVVIGLSRGIGGVAYAALLPSLFAKEDRVKLLNLEGILSSCAAIAVTFATFYLFKSGSSSDSHVVLAFLALLAAIPAAALLLPVREPDRQVPASARAGAGSDKGNFKNLWERFASCWKYKWFRRYLTGRVLMLSVSQVMPFYAIHAASIHHHQPGSYAAFVIAMSSGAILSGPILYRLASKSIGANLTVSILTAMTAAVLALVVDLFVAEPQFYLYAPIFVLVALAEQISMVALTVYLGDAADEGVREYFIATSQVATGVFGVAAAALLGMLAQIHDEAIPITIILGFNLLALVFVLFGFETPARGDAARNEARPKAS